LQLKTGYKKKFFLSLCPHFYVVRSTRAGRPVESTSNILLVELVHSFRKMQDEIRDLREQVRNVHINQGNFNELRANLNDVPHDEWAKFGKSGQKSITHSIMKEIV